MNQQGLDEIDRRILDLIRDNARLRYSEIGQMVGISRVSVRNRMEQMEKSGVIRGYRTVMDQTMVPQGSRFFLQYNTKISWNALPPAACSAGSMGLPDRAGSMPRASLPIRAS